MKIVNKTQDVDTLFVDGISSAYFLNGAVRLTVGSLQTDDEVLMSDNPTAEQEPAFKHELKLVMSLNGFAAAFKAQQELYEELIQKGAIPNPNATDTNMQNAAVNNAAPTVAVNESVSINNTTDSNESPNLKFV